MLIPSVLIACICVYLCMVKPVLRAQDMREEYAFMERYRDFQAYAVRKYHPAFRDNPYLAQLSLREIRRKYNVSDAYHQLAWRYKARLQG